MPFSTPTCYHRAALLRSPPIPPIPRPTACTLVTTRDPTEPLCSSSVYLAEGRHLTMLPTDSRIAAIPLSGRVGFPELVTDLSPTPPTIWTKKLPSSSRSGSIPFLQTLDPLPPPFHGYPGPNHPAFIRPPTVPPGQLFRLPTSVPWFPQPQQPHGLSLPSQLFSCPPINRIKTPNGPSAFLGDTTADGLRITVHRRSRVDVSVFTAFPISTLVRHHGVLFPVDDFFSCCTCPSCPTIDCFCFRFQ